MVQKKKSYPHPRGSGMVFPTCVPCLYSLFLASPGGEQQRGLHRHFGEPGEEVRVKTAGKDDKSDFSLLIYIPRV